MRLWIHLMVTGYYPSRVSPFGDLRIYACLRLPEAFRSLPRPSSAIGARASTLCSFLLDLSYPAWNAFHAGRINRMDVCRTHPYALYWFFRKDLLSLCLSLCSFQGAKSPEVSSLFGVDPSKRYSERFFKEADSVFLFVSVTDSVSFVSLSYRPRI